MRQEWIVLNATSRKKREVFNNYLYVVEGCIILLEYLSHNEIIHGQFNISGAVHRFSFFTKKLVPETELLLS